MENDPSIKQFQVTLYQDEILVTTPSNNKEAFRAKINIPNGTSIKLLDKYGSHFHWIETQKDELNYTECCGILKLFGIAPPTFVELCSLLKIEYDPTDNPVNEKKIDQVKFKVIALKGIVNEMLASTTVSAGSEFYEEIRNVRNEIDTILNQF